jgi:hypothetical protein
MLILLLYYGYVLVTVKKMIKLFAVCFQFNLLSKNSKKFVDRVGVLS